MYFFKLKKISAIEATIHSACENGDLGGVENFVKQTRKAVELKDEKGTYPLHIASANGHLKIVKFLVEKEAEIDAKDKFDRCQFYLHFTSTFLCTKEFFEQYFSTYN